MLEPAVHSLMTRMGSLVPTCPLPFEHRFECRCLIHGATVSVYVRRLIVVLDERVGWTGCWFCSRRCVECRMPPSRRRGVTHLRLGWLHWLLAPKPGSWLLDRPSSVPSPRSALRDSLRPAEVGWLGMGSGAAGLRMRFAVPACPSTVHRAAGWGLVATAGLAVAGPPPSEMS